jgi:hypothetical protein
MKGKYLVCLLCSFFILYQANAQSEKEAKIFLKNGVKIQGAIVSSYHDRLLNVKSSDTDSIQIRYDLIRKIKFIGPGSLDIENDRLSPAGIPVNTFFHEIRGGLLFGEENVSGTLQTINGYQFNKYLGTGLGIGMNKFGNYFTLPVYASIKGYLKDQKISPFYHGDIGYGFAWADHDDNDPFRIKNVKGGLYWQLGVGYQFSFYDTSFILVIGYLNQYSTAEYDFQSWGSGIAEISEKRTLRRLNFSLGFAF